MQRLKEILRPIYAPWLRRYRYRAKIRAERQRILADIQTAKAAGEPVKIIIGAGGTRYAGWIPTDIPAFNVCRADHWPGLFSRHSIDRILAEHVFEHLTRAQMADFLRIARNYLAPGGRVRIAVPDGYHPDPAYIERVRPGGSSDFADDHKMLYNSDLIGALLAEQGYDYELLEYFDEAGQFQQREWRIEDGFIGRSAAHDGRNADGLLRFTSLIVDCWPGPTGE